MSLGRRAAFLIFFPRVAFPRVALALAAAMFLDAPAHAVVSLPTGFIDETLVTGLNEPNSFAFLPDGRLLITEQRTGNVRVVLANHALVSTPAYHVDGLSISHTERGLQGIAVDPRWPSPAYIYLNFDRTSSQQWIVRLTATGNLTDPLSSNLSFIDPRILIHNIRDVAGNHNGGTLRFGPDGHLYASIGDDALPCASQVVDSLLGKLLRLDVTRIPPGAGGPVPRAMLIPPDNPIASPDSNARLVYAMGLRNPWRFHIDPSTGIAYVADVGENATEEVNAIVPGANYGWPFREGTATRTVTGCTEPGGPGGTSYAAPIASLSHSTGYSAILTGTVYRPVPTGNANWPQSYWGSLFFGDYYTIRMRRMVKTGSTWGYAPAVPGQPTSSEWATGMMWVVDFTVGPDGSLYWLKAGNDAFQQGTGMVRRIRYTGTTTAVGPSGGAPDGVRSVPNPFSGHVELSASFPTGGPVRVAVFDASGRRLRSGTAAEADIGSFRWVWDGRDEGGRPAAPGIYLARFESGGVTRTTRLLRTR